MEEIIGSSVLIAGLGREGRSVLKYIEKKQLGLQVTLADKNPAQLVDFLTYTTIGGPKYLHTAHTFDTVVRSPGISRQTPDLKKVRHITTPTNLFFSECLGTTIGVIGTKGKSTTSSLIYHILETAQKDTRLVGNIGHPALDALEGSNDQTIFVAELSSYQLDDLRYSPHVAVVLPITREHLNYHGSFDAYLEAKSHIAYHQEKDDYVIFYGQNTNSRYVAFKSLGTKIPYAENNVNNPVATWFEDDSIWVRTDVGKPHKLIGRGDVPLLGKANLENIMAALLVAKIIDINEEDIRKAIKTFKPLEHRLELVGAYSGIIFYNDSLATIPEATAHALEALGDKVTTLIAGGFDRGIDMSLLGKAISNSSVGNLILFPTTGEKIAQVVKAYSHKSINVVMVQTMEEAVSAAYKLTPSGTICLMSPAAASFNHFKDYADRGDQFKENVRKYFQE